MLVLLTGPTGSGKTSLTALTAHRFGWHVINVFSTRPARSTPMYDTKDIVPQDEMSKLVARDDFLTHSYDGHQYATPLRACRQAAASRAPITIVDWVHPHPDDVRFLGIFVVAVVLVPSANTLKHRLAHDGRPGRCARALAEVKDIEAHRDSYGSPWTVIDADHDLDVLAERLHELVESYSF